MWQNLAFCIIQWGRQLKSIKKDTHETKFVLDWFNFSELLRQTNTNMYRRQNMLDGIKFSELVRPSVQWTEAATQPEGSQRKKTFPHNHLNWTCDVAIIITTWEDKMFHCRLVLNGASPVGFLLISCQAGFACNPRLHSASSCCSSSQTACRPFWRQGGMPGCLKYKVSQAFSSSCHLLYDIKIFLTFSPPRVSRSWWPSNRGCWGLVQQRPTAPQIDSSASPGERTLCMYAERVRARGPRHSFTL